MKQFSLRVKQSDYSIFRVDEAWQNNGSKRLTILKDTIAAGRRHTVGLKYYGIVVAVGWNEYDQCNVCDWRDIVAVAAGCAHTIGLKSDGTVVAVGDNEYGQCEVGGWCGIQLPSN